MFVMVPLVHNNILLLAAGYLTRKKKRQLLDILGSPIIQTTRADDLRVQICQILQPRWSILYGPRNHMPIGGYKITKTTIEGVETNARTVLAMRYKVGVAMHNMARWMQYTLEWRDYYKQQKKKMCHQESKGIVQQVVRKWYRQGHAALQYPKCDVTATGMGCVGRAGKATVEPVYKKDTGMHLP